MTTPFLSLLDTILTKGVERRNERTGYRTVALFGPQIEYDLSEGLPLLTSRKLTLRPVLAELLWFLSGSTNSIDLNNLGAKVWDQWALTPEDVTHSHLNANVSLFTRLTRYIFAHGDEGEEDYHVGDLGPIYGCMWRAWPGPDGEVYDQIQYVMDQLKNDPYSRRIIVSGWNPAYLPNERLTAQQNVLHGKQALAPCHTMFQFFVEPLSIEEKQKYHEITAERLDTIDRSEYEMLLDNGPQQKLSCKLYARSQDVPIGTAFNIPMYAILTMMLARQFNMVPGRYIHTIGDAHIYENQIDLVKHQLTLPTYAKPKLLLKPPVGTSILDYTTEDFELMDYQHGPLIKFPIAI